MGAYDDILRWIREQERILKPIRDFEKLFGSAAHSIAAEAVERDRMLQSALAGLPTSYEHILHTKTFRNKAS